MEIERYEVSWSRAAVEDLDEILDFLAEAMGLSRAMELYATFRRRIGQLKEHPGRCRRVPEFRGLGLGEHRELILPPYRIFFRLRGRRIFLLGVLDSRRDLEELLLQRVVEDGPGMRGQETKEADE
ncbi:MAG: type II toxin-antitoxin system RelE/ParE family toxin [Acidobacteria bacterium]|nr:type II toxin-antitoxin system RelE/ParE family toxin [Acidobacteriota bacterium]